MKLAIATMIKCESRRYLPALLRAWQEFADELIVLDNNENNCDDKDLIQEVWQKSLILEWFPNAAWGNESGFRQKLFTMAQTSDADWLLWLDADMISLRDPKPLMQHATTDAIAFPLYDLWQQQPLKYREDRFWRAHLHQRIWAIRKPSVDFIPEWATQGLHCGHLPLNYVPLRTLTAPQKYAILHYGYADAEDRKLKHAAYMSQAEILSPQQVAHAESIIDPEPNLLTLPFEPKWSIEHESRKS